MPLFITDYPTQVTASSAQPVYVTGALNTIPSGTQTVQGTVTANIGTTNGLMLDNTFTARINTLGQKTAANSTPVVLASDQSALTISGSVGATQVGTWTVQPGNTANTTPWLMTINNGSSAAVKAASTAPVAADPALVVALSPNMSTVTVPVKEVRTTTTSLAQVTVNSTSTSILASSGSRLGATIFNPSTSVSVYIALGQTPTTSLYTVKLGPGGYYEVPGSFTGAVNGIVAAGSQVVNVTDFA